jgi:hypothetical protein
MRANWIKFPRGVFQRSKRTRALILIEKAERLQSRNMPRRLQRSLPGPVALQALLLLIAAGAHVGYQYFKLTGANGPALV